MKRKSGGAERFAGSQLCSATLVKRLASTDAKSRNRALQVLLTTWLPSQTEILEDDMRKLWKAIFYCFWHSDKLPEQSRLADRLSSMILDLPIPMALDFFSVFLLTMRREWGGIDFLRLDKFYLLIRRFLRGVFSLLKKSAWNLELVGQVIKVVMERTFLDAEKSEGNGVNYHVASVFLEELKSFLPLKREVAEAIFLPFVNVFGISLDKILLKKLKNCFFDELVKAGRQLLDGNGGNSEPDDMSFLGFIGVGLGFSKTFYGIGSSSECVQGNRKIAFELHESFLKLEKDYESSGIEVLFPDIIEDEEEIPQLVPIDSAESLQLNGYDNEEEKGVKGKGNRSKFEEGKQKRKNVSTGTGKREKKKSGNADSGPVQNGNVAKNDDVVNFSESVIANLQMHFDKVAKEIGLDACAESCCTLKEADDRVSEVTKKRKKARNKGSVEALNGCMSELAKLNDDGEASNKTGDRSSKKVSFSMKNNLVWNAHSPLPPQDLRLPPSATPRGSALKKGVPPGPIREVATSAKKSRGRTKRLAKKSNKGLMVTTPTIIRKKKQKSFSA